MFCFDNYDHNEPSQHSKHSSLSQWVFQELLLTWGPQELWTIVSRSKLVVLLIGLCVSQWVIPEQTVKLNIHSEKNITLELGKNVIREVFLTLIVCSRGLIHNDSNTIIVKKHIS